MRKKLLAIFALLLITASYSQDISLYEQFNGRYDFTFVGNTLNPSENNVTETCTINTSSSASLNLSPDDTILAAYLYWAGSGTGDFDILLNGQAITAERNFPLLASNTDGISRAYFSAFANVTDQVKATGNGTYTVSELDLTAVVAQELYCGIKTNFGGWAIAVFYENASLPLNQINLYDGLEYVPNSINITLPSLNVVDNDGAKIGFIAWEGDSSLAIAETLTINGSILSNDLNPPTNAFNSTNSVTGMSTLYNMDLDIYDIENYINVGDETADIALTSGQDFVMINTIITKLNSQLPDATIAIDDISKDCGKRTLTVDYTVHNSNSTAPLPAATPIAVYLNGDLINTMQTLTELPINGSESGTVVLNIPNDVTGEIEIIFVVDDMGNGTGGIVTEINEANNTVLFTELLWTLEPIDPQDITECETASNSNVGLFDFSGYEESLKTDPDQTITFYNSLEDAQVPTDPINNPDNYTSTSNPEEIFVRLDDPNGCFTIASFNLIAKDCTFPDATVVIGPITTACDSRVLQVNYTVNNFEGSDVLPANTPVSIYVNGTLITTTATSAAIPIGGSLNASITITIPAGVPQTFDLLFVVDDNGTGTGTVIETDETNNSFTLSFTLWVSPILIQPEDVTACETFNGSGIGVFDFSSYTESLKNTPTDVITFHTLLEDAESGENAITNPEEYTSASDKEIFVRLEDKNGCFDTASFMLILKDCYFPDGTVVIDDVYKQCNSRILHVHYTVSNFDGTDILPAQTPVAIYANTVLLDITETLNDIAIDGSEAGFIELTVPIGIPLDFDLTFVVDDIGNGTGIVIELNENNNGFTKAEKLPLSPVLQQPEDIESCDKGFGSGTFDFSHYAEELKNYPDEIVTFYTSQQNADQDLDRIYNTSQYIIEQNPTRIYVRLFNGTCHTTASFLLRTKKCPPKPYNYVTPNGDGINDGFFVDGLRNIFLNFKMSIYNRWGTLIWTGDHSQADWNAVADVSKVGSEGTSVPVGTYYFVLELNDTDYPEPIVGWVYVTK